MNKFFNEKGEIAFRLRMFSNDVDVLRVHPNQEKASNLKSKMEAFAEVIKEKGTPENLKDIKELIDEL